MRFAAAHYFYWLMVIPLVLTGGLVSIVRRRNALRACLDANLIQKIAPEASTERDVFRLVLLVAGLSLLIIALARPQFGTHSTLIKRRGVDVVVALDTSKSMLARDVSSNRSINRLKRAKMEVSGLINRLSGDRIGLLAFSGAAFVQCPLTSDYAAAKLFLRAMNAGSIPVGGTNFAEALSAAKGMFKNARSASRSKVLIIISDGEDHAGGYEKEVEELKDMGVVIHGVGIGTRIGELIPGKDGKYMRSNGKTVMTRLHEATLRSIAEATGGMYIHSAAGDLGFEAIYEELNRMQKSDYESRIETVYEEKFQLFAFMALLALLAATIVPSRRSVHPKGG